MDLPYSVMLASSNPEAEDFDALDTGKDFATLAEARACVSNLAAHFNMSYYRNSAWIILDGPDVHEIRYDAKAYARAQRENAASLRAERREAAMQAGMMGGCDAYNDAMGF